MYGASLSDIGVLAAVLICFGQFLHAMFCRVLSVVARRFSYSVA